MNTMGSPGPESLRDPVLKLFDAIYVVSLVRCADRRAHVQRHLYDYGLDHFVFFDATDRNDPLVTTLRKAGRVAAYPPCFRCGQLDCGDPNCNNFLTDAQVATCITYERLMAEIACGAAETVLIVEDDVVFHPYAGRILEELAQAIGGKVTGFGCVPWRNVGPRKSMRPALIRLGRALESSHDGSRIFRLTSDVTMSNCCFGVNRAFAQLASTAFDMIDTTADILIHDRVGHRAVSLTVDPPIASELSWSTGAVESEIHAKPIRIDYLLAENRPDEAARYVEVIKADSRRALTTASLAAKKYFTVQAARFAELATARHAQSIEQPPFFSVIIPTYNVREKLPRSVDSVLAQNGTGFEIIVVDGASIDGTVDVIKSYAERNPDVVRWVSEKDKGVYDAMNKGIDLARGKYLYFLGAGDMLREGVFAKIKDHAPEQAAAFIYGNVFCVSQNRFADGRFDRPKLAIKNLCHQSIFYGRRIFDAVGRYESRYPVLADWVLNMKCFRASAIRKIYVDMVIADYEGGGMSDNAEDHGFINDKPSLMAEVLGVRLRERPFFAVERRLAKRVAASRTNVARKFWHAQLWLLHTFVRPLLPSRLRSLTPHTPVQDQYYVTLEKEI